MEPEKPRYESQVSADPVKSNLQQDENVGLDPAHAEYLLQRHGTLELDPLPSTDPMDPLNWPNWRKNLYLSIYAFHGFQAGFLAAGLVPATPMMAEAYGVSLNAATYLVSSQIAMYGVVPFIWLPIMERIGRRPSLLISTLGATAFNIGGAFCTTYGQQMATRCLTAVFIAPPTALGGIVVTELFFRHQRGAKTGIWKLFFTLGAPAGPFIFGFVAKYAGLRWIYGVMALTTFAIFVLYFFFGPETKYKRRADYVTKETAATRPSQLAFMRFHPLHCTPWSVRDAIHPFKTFGIIRIIVPIVAYAIVFAYTTIGIVINQAQVAGLKFHLDAEGIGLNYIAILIGLVLGEIVGGLGSDAWMKWKTTKRGGNKNRVIEDRLWLAYPGLVLVAVGLVVWGVKSQQAAVGHWIVSPSVGAAIASFGSQLITTVLVTYAIDVDPSRAAETGLVINLVRQEWGFIGPFYFPKMFTNLGFGGAAGVMAAIVVVVAGSPVMLIQFTNIGARAKHPDLDHHSPAPLAEE